MRRGLLRIAFFTGRKEKRLPDARDEGCTCIDMQVVHNVPEYAAKFLRPHNLKNRVSVYMEREVRDAAAGNLPLPDISTISCVNIWKHTRTGLTK